MPPSPLSAVVRHIRALAERTSGAMPPDHHLLERFIQQHDEEAFALLVRRHGGMVLSVAHRILHDVHAAEDVFQNTFLTLARRAASIRKREALASWLYGVAARLASQIRMQEARRTKRERAAAKPLAEDAPEATAWRELGGLLDEELQRLPEKYRTPLVLIYFAGQTQESAARQLEWSLGTLRRRLERGKRLLHDRLLRRGVSLSIGLMTTAIAQSVTEAALPALLVERTVQEALRIAAVQATGWLIGTAVLTRAKIALMLGLLFTAGAGLAVLPRMSYPQGEEKPQGNAPPPTAPEAKGPRVDRFGDPLPQGALVRMGTIRFRHGAGTTAAFTSDGKSLLTAGSDHTIRTWDASNGRLLREQRLSAGPYSPVLMWSQLSPDARLLAFLDTIDTMCIWDVARNQLRHKFALKGGWPHLAFTPDGRGLTAVGPGALKRWDLISGRIVRQHSTPPLRGIRDPQFARSFRLSPNGHIAATGQTDTTILLWDLSPLRDRPAAPLSVRQREACWMDLVGDDAGHALAAIARLADAPQQVVPLLRERLHPAKAPPAQELKRLFADLDDSQFERRETAAKRLKELDDLAHAALREALSSKPSLEVRRRIEGLLAESHLARSPETRRNLRAARVLERIGTFEARRILEALANGARGARLTEAARAAVQRLARRP